MIKGRYRGPDKRRSERQEKKFNVTMEYEGESREMRTMDISEHGVLIPKRVPPPIGAHVKLTLTIRGETGMFTGIVKRHTKNFVNGVLTIAMGIDISSPGYQEFVNKNIPIAQVRGQESQPLPETLR